MIKTGSRKQKTEVMPRIRLYVFLQWWKGHQAQRRHELRSRLEDLFTALDKNGDETLEWEEFQHFQSMVRQDEVLSERLREVQMHDTHEHHNELGMLDEDVAQNWAALREFAVVLENGPVSTVKLKEQVEAAGVVVHPFDQRTDIMRKLVELDSSHRRNPVPLNAFLKWFKNKVGDTSSEIPLFPEFMMMQLETAADVLELPKPETGLNAMEQITKGRFPLFFCAFQ